MAEYGYNEKAIKFISKFSMRMVVCGYLILAVVWGVTFIFIAPIFWLITGLSYEKIFKKIDRNFYEKLWRKI